MQLLAIFAALISLALPPPGAPGAGGPADESAKTAIVIQASSAAWTERVEWGIERFRDAGLTLPSMTVTVHDDHAPCGGNSGLYLPGEPAEVHLCALGAPDSRPARLTTLHELAHAWAEARLSAADRLAFLGLRGLEAWWDAGIPRHQRGSEHAAEVVSWGLMDEMVPIIRIYDAEPAQLLEAFDLLVHRPPLWSTPATPAAAPG